MELRYTSEMDSHLKCKIAKGSDHVISVDIAKEALKHCLIPPLDPDHEDQCVGCPLQDLDSFECMDKLRKDSVGLLTELTRRIEDLKKGVT